MSAAILDWAVQTGLGVSVLICVILLIRRPVARAFGANAAYALWALPVIRLFLPVIAIPTAWLPQPFQTGATNTLDVPPVYFPESAVNNAVPEIATMSDRVPPLVALPTLLICVWLGVAVVWLAFQLMRQRAFRHSLQRQTSAVSDLLQAEAQMAAQAVGLRHTPDLRQSTGALGPFVTGVFKPIVIIPDGFADDFDAAQRQFALVHEFAHIKRRDLWVAFAALVFRALNWFNPLVHFAAHKMRVDQEAACDAYVLARTGEAETAPLHYAQTLLQAARLRKTGDLPSGLALSLAVLDPSENKLSGKGDIS